MDPRDLIDRLERQGRWLDAAFAGLDDADAAWRPEPDKWSMRDVLGHLVDEEREDFRTRVRLTLQDPEAEWPAIDPEGRVRARRADPSGIEQLRQQFRAEREASLHWLRSLEGADWTRAHLHPRAGRLSAGDLLASWVAHDLLHLAQLARLALGRARERARPCSTSYAG